LYVIRAGKGALFKIGISTDPKARLRTLQTGSASELNLIRSVGCSSADFESNAHRILARWRSHGEWFDLGTWAETFVFKIKYCKAENLLVTLREVDTLPVGLTVPVDISTTDESLGSKPIDDPRFFAVHSRISNPFCLDCDANTLTIGEYYHVFSHVWDAAIRRAPLSSRQSDVYAPEGREPRVNYTIFAESITPLRAPKKPPTKKAEPAKPSTPEAAKPPPPAAPTFDDDFPPHFENPYGGGR
jgi:hypothetical protein